MKVIFLNECRICEFEIGDFIRSNRIQWPILMLVQAAISKHLHYLSKFSSLSERVVKVNRTGIKVDKSCQRLEKGNTEIEAQKQVLTYNARNCFLILCTSMLKWCQKKISAEYSEELNEKLRQDSQGSKDQVIAICRSQCAI